MKLRSVILVTICMASTNFASCREEPTEITVVRPIRAMRIAHDSTLESRRFPGQAKPVQEVELSFRVAGTLIQLIVDIGDEVEAGHVVAQLDPRDFEVQIKDSEAAVALARAELAQADDQLERTNRALQSGAATEFEVTSSREAKNAAAAQVASSEAKLEAAQDGLKYATLAAPFKGTVTAKYVENFQDVMAKQQVVRILDDSRIEMIVFIPENFMSNDPTVAQVRCEFDALPGVELPADIKEIGKEADPVTRTYPVTLIMDQPAEFHILSGMTGNAWTIQPPVITEADVFALPLSALGEDANGTRFVWIVDEERNEVQRRDVEVGDMVQGGILVRGVQNGEVVATAGAAFLVEGQQVHWSDKTTDGADA